MSQQLSFGTNGKFIVRYSTDQMLQRIQPFICQTAKNLASGWTLDNSVQSAADDHPEATDYFVIRPGETLESFGLKDELLYQNWRVAGLDMSGGSHSHLRIDTADDRDCAESGRVLRLLATGHTTLELPSGSRGRPMAANSTPPARTGNPGGGAPAQPGAGC